MNQEDFNCFLHLCTSLHFGNSARELHKSASSLTRSIQRLEQAVGHPLLLRDRRSVALTPAGTRFQRFALEQRSAWELLQAELQGKALAPHGQLKIACTVTACYSLLPRLIAQCRERYPAISLELKTQDAAQALRSLEAASVDFAVLPLPASLPPSLQAAALGSTSLIFIAPRRPAKFQRWLSKPTIDWALIPLVAPLEGLERQRLNQWLAGLEKQPQIYTEVAGNEGILSMVSMGCGIALIPKLVWERSPQKQEVLVIDTLAPPQGYEIGLCARQRTLAHPTLQAFWQLAMTEGQSGPKDSELGQDG